MSCFYTSEEKKRNVIDFLSQFNSLMRDCNVDINFLDGTLYIEGQYAGNLEDTCNSVRLEDAEGLELYETDFID